MCPPGFSGLRLGCVALVLCGSLALGTTGCRRGTERGPAASEPAAVGFKAVAPASAPRIEELHLLYDMTPPSAENPIVARIADYRIEVPAAELRAFLASETPLARQEGRWSGGLDDRRRLLDRLLNDHLFMWEGYRQKADQDPAITRRLQETEKLLLAEELQRLEVGDRAKTASEQQRVQATLRKRLIEKAMITVSNEALAELRGTARRLSSAPIAGRAPSGQPAGAPAAPEVPPETSERTLAVCALAPANLTVTIGDFLQLYRQMPATRRPDLESKEAVVDILAQVLEPELLVVEARARGLAQSDSVRSLVQQNRNTMVRMWVLDQLTAEAARRTHQPDHQQRLRKWYADHLQSHYTYRDERGQLRTQPFDQNRQSIENDYFEDLVEAVRAEKIAAWRQGRRVEIDDVYLGQMAIPER